MYSGKWNKIHARVYTRLLDSPEYSRAYVFEDAQGHRNVFVSVDAGMMGQLVKKKVNRLEYPFIWD